VIAFIFRGFIASSDAASSWFSPFYNLKEIFFVWSTYNIPGSSIPNSFTSFFLRLYYSIFDSMIHNPEFVQKASWIVFFEVAAFVTFHFVNKYYLHNKWYSLFATLFVLFNPISQYFLWGKQHWAYYLVPIYFICSVLYKKYFDSGNMMYLYGISFISFFCGFAFNQPAYFATLALFIACIFLWNFSQLNNRCKIIVDHFKFLSFSLLINAVYFVPMFFGGYDKIQAVKANYAGGDAFPILRDLQHVNFFYSFINITKGYGKFYSLNHGVLIGWTIFYLLIIYFVFIGKKFFNKRDKEYLLILFIFLLALIFLNKGITEPWPNFSKYIYSFDIMYIFRDFKDKMALGYSLVLSIFYIYLFKIDIRLFKMFLVVISIMVYVTFLNNTWFTPGLIYSNNLNYLKEANFSTLGASRILNLPLVNYSFFYTNSPNYSGNSPLKNIFHQDVLYTTNLQNNDIKKLKLMLESGAIDEELMQSYLQKYNVEYILNNKNSFVKEDKNPYAYDYSRLQSLNFLEMVQDTDKFQVYKYDNYKPRIYGSDVSFQKISPIEYRIFVKNVDSVSEITFLESFSKGWNLYLKKNPSSGWCAPVAYSDANSTTTCEENKDFMFSVLPIGDTNPSIFFGENKFINKQTGNDDYFNKWDISKEFIEENFDNNFYHINPDGSIDIELVLYFKPQIYFYLGLLISGTTLLTCLGYLFYIWKGRWLLATLTSLKSSLHNGSL
jgi:hypothetical protein